jgi:hypothetical protein
MTVDASVQQLVDRYLVALDAARPGLVEALYLTGSVALDDYHAPQSDVDFLAVTGRPVRDRDLDAIAAVHAALPARPHFDGVYLDRATLAGEPDDEPVAPHVLHGVFHADQPCFELNPVLWVALARHGVTVRGPRIATLGLRADRSRLTRWTLDNLTAYWLPLAERIQDRFADPAGDGPVNADIVGWTVLGPPRLHHTLATGDVISKSGAGPYIAEHFPAWAELADRCVSQRHGAPVAFTAGDAVAAAALAMAVIRDAWTRWAS